MSLAIVYSRASVGTDAPVVTVEAHLSRGLPSFSLVGLPETAVKESRDRVRGAILSAGFEFPRKRIIVNLAPADLPKEGGRFDLAIALGILIASKQVKDLKLQQYVFLGELALSGELREVRGALIAALSLKSKNKALVLPRKSAEQAALAENVNVLTAESLGEVCAALNGIGMLTAVLSSRPSLQKFDNDLNQVIGHQFAKRALEIAAAGNHSLLMRGPPGVGKTMLASRIGSILPPMSEQEALETAAIASLSYGGFTIEQWKHRPFRSPHHSASGAALIGGGSIPGPGEISLAHNGVLFLDEITEFNRNVLELLREPMESGKVNISRASRQATFMARFLLIAAANPCPCGYLGGPDPGRCRCSPEQIMRYQSKLSGPLLDRIDMHLHINGISRAEMRQQSGKNESSQQIQQRVIRARQIQLARQSIANGNLDSTDVRTYCGIDPKQTELLDKIIDKFRLSTRAAHRILKLARTIADLGDRENIEQQDLLEAAGLRCKHG